MAKTDFTKVEGALDEGLRKITVSKLLTSADEASGKGEAVAAEHQAATQRQLLIALQQDMKKLHKQIPELYTKVSMNQKKLKDFLEHPEKLTPQDWEEIKKVRKQCDHFKEELAKKMPQDVNDDIISKERRKHVNKRFNINDKWLPLR